jgi:GNAT superfamily N-acetyltransferase
MLTTPTPDHQRTATSTNFTITPGALQDYHALSPHHYRARPATIARAREGSPAILAARDQHGGLAGVLVVSMPTLNGAWRALAWPGAFESGDKRRDAARLNRELRCISRVIVHPRARSCGVATALVRAYLERPLTRATEAVAAMGHACAFFERAGMTPYRLPPRRRDARLLDALASRALEPWELLFEGAAEAALDASRWLEREARLWANAHGETRALAGAPAPDLLTFACARIACTPTAYTHGDPS